MAEKTENAFLGTEKLGTLMRKYAVPCVISLLVAANSGTLCFFLF
ncbi:MAG: hypothetical protein ACI4K8_03905 [Candidatus Fimenecus sp.]